MTQTNASRTIHPPAVAGRIARRQFVPLALAVLAVASPAAIASPADPRPSAVVAPAGVAEDEGRLSDLERKVKELEEALRAVRQGDGADASRVAELERRLEVLSRELEKLRLGAVAEAKAGESVHGLGPAASKVYGAAEGVSIGGYGEMLFQGFDSQRDDGTPGGKIDTLDFLRAVTYVGYKFSDNIIFNSELEFEHASSGKQGEVSVEFAYLDFLLRPQLNIRTGLVLVPMGFLNELHEPPVFLGARRPDVESKLIPSTWRENGAGIFGDIGPVSYRVYVVNGLDGAGINKNGGFSSSGIRDARQKGSKSAAEDFAVVGRADWRIIPAFSIGGSFYFGDSGQGAIAPTSMRRIDARTEIHEVHAEWRWRGIEARGLHVGIDIDDVLLLNDALGLAPMSSIGEEMEGYYVQLGYDVLTEAETEHSLIPFVRWEAFDTQKRVPVGFMPDPAKDVELMTYGFSYKPLANVVVKVDFQDFDNDAGTGHDQWNLAVGFLF